MGQNLGEAELENYLSLEDKEWMLIVCSCMLLCCRVLALAYLQLAQMVDGIQAVVIICCYGVTG